jgi:hypothetical protein
MHPNPVGESPKRLNPLDKKCPQNDLAREALPHQSHNLLEDQLRLVLLLDDVFLALGIRHHSVCQPLFEVVSGSQKYWPILPPYN